MCRFGASLYGCGNTCELMTLYCSLMPMVLVLFHTAFPIRMARHKTTGEIIHHTQHCTAAGLIKYLPVTV